MALFITKQDSDPINKSSTKRRTNSDIRIAYNAPYLSGNSGTGSKTSTFTDINLEAGETYCIFIFNDDRAYTGLWGTSSQNYTSGGTSSGSVITSITIKPSTTYASVSGSIAQTDTKQEVAIKYTPSDTSYSAVTHTVTTSIDEATDLSEILTDIPAGTKGTLTITPEGGSPLTYDVDLTSSTTLDLGSIDLSQCFASLTGKILNYTGSATNVTVTYGEGDDAVSITKEVNNGDSGITDFTFTNLE